MIKKKPFNYIFTENEGVLKIGDKLWSPLSFFFSQAIKGKEVVGAVQKSLQ